jgi:HAD superfamily phosphatase (TIGR01668 family)
MAGFLSVFRPDMFAHRVVDIDVSALKEEGAQLVILDLDNTLLPWKSSEIGDDVVAWIARIKAAGMKPMILSNTHYPKRLTKIAAILDVPSISHALKPWRWQFRKAARLAGCEYCKAVVVGDQLLTDILGGNLAGMKTILVKPMHPHEFLGTKISRMVERLILSRVGETPGSGDSAQGTKSVGYQSQTKDTK